MNRSFLSFTFPLAFCSSLLMAVPPAHESKSAPGLHPSLPYDTALLCGSFLDEKSIARLAAVSRATRQLVDKDLRRDAAASLTEPVILDFTRPATRRPTYAGYRHLLLVGLQEEMKEDPFSWLATAQEVETISIVNPGGGPSVAQLLRLRALPRLTSLMVRCLRLGPSTPEEIAQARAFLPARPATLTSLSLFDAYGVYCQGPGLLPLLEGCALREAHLGGCALAGTLRGRFFRHLAAWLPAQAGTLQHLTLSLSGGSDGEARRVSAMLRRLPNLRSLALRDWNYEDLEPFGIEVQRHLGATLARLVHLETLDLLGLPITGAQGDCGAFLLGLPPSIRELHNLNSFEVDGRPSPMLMAALGRSPGLRALSFLNLHSLAAAHPFFTALATLPELQELSFALDLENHDPDLADAALEGLEQLFRAAGKRLLLEW